MTVVGRMTAAAVVVAGSVVAGSVMLGGAAHAAVVTRQAESGQITSPTDGQVVTGGSVSISAHTGMMQLSMGLYVEGPSTSKQKIASGGANQTISGSFDAGSAPNGTFTVTLKGEISNSTYATSTFKLKRPAAAPNNVNAAMQGKNKILVTWAKGTEPDLQSYEVSTTESGIVGRLGADSACSGASCKAVLAVPAKAEGQKVGFTVKAYRGDGDGGSLGSGASGAAYLTIPAAKAAQPKKTTGPNTQQNKKDTTQNLPTLPNKKHTTPTTLPTNRTAPKNTDKLPTMPDTDSKGNFPLPTATQNDALAPDSSKKETTPADSQVKAQSSESPMGSVGQYGLYVAGGLLLLLLAAHGGAWARRRSLAAAGRGSGPAAPAVAVPTVSGGGPHLTDSAVPTTTAPRRPAVVLAVAKTRTSDATSRAASGAASLAGSGVSSRAASGAASLTGSGVSSRADDGADFRTVDDANSRAADAARVSESVARSRALSAAINGQATVSAANPHMSDSAEHLRPSDAASDLPVNGAAADPHGDDFEVDGRSADAAAVAGAADAGSDQVRTGSGDPQSNSGHPRGNSAQSRTNGGQSRGNADHSRASSDRPRTKVPEQGRLETQVPLPLPLSVDDLRPRQEPIRIALPSSAVTVMPDKAPVTTPAVRIEDRWDDYLPSAPRAMEDSGFWERPEPGDFWAADQETARKVEER